jgi:hypothetical protein
VSRKDTLLNKDTRYRDGEPGEVGIHVAFKLVESRKCGIVGIVEEETEQRRRVRPPWSEFKSDSGGFTTIDHC